MAKPRSSWLAPVIEPRPGGAPRMAALPPNVVVVEPGSAFIRAPDPPIPAPPPSVEDLRQRIAAASDALAAAEAASSAASAALLKAEQHRAQCAAELKSFDDLGDQAKDLHVAALRGDRQVDLTDELRQRVAQRDLARLNLDAATAAVEPFAREAAVARDEATAKRIALSYAASALVSTHALHLLGRRRDLARQLDAVDSSLRAFEQFAAPMVPRPIAEFILSQHAAGARVAIMDTTRWRDLHHRLSADPAAKLEL